MPRPKSEKTGPVLSLRLGDDLMDALRDAAKRLNKPFNDVVREAMKLGLADWKAIDYRTDEILATAAQNARAAQRDELALVAETNAPSELAATRKEVRYQTGKKARSAIARVRDNTAFYIVQRDSK